jgi:hypothetical protein
MKSITDKIAERLEQVELEREQERLRKEQRAKEKAELIDSRVKEFTQELIKIGVSTDDIRGHEMSSDGGNIIFTLVVMDVHVRCRLCNYLALNEGVWQWSEDDAIQVWSHHYGANCALDALNEAVIQCVVKNKEAYS